MTKKQAFSLAEILVTLMIIGVIAGMTMPALRKDSMNKTVSTNLKKIYSELNQAFSLALTENYTNRLCRTGLLDDAETFEKEFIRKKLNVVAECSAGNADNCFGNSDLVTDKSYLLNSGIAIAFSFVDCSSDTEINIPVYIDVNGPKPPNKGGTDQFLLDLNGIGVVKTSGRTDVNCGSATDDYEAAWACVAQIQRDGWEIKY